MRFGDLKPGDFVVHEEHGVGRYVGLKEFPRASDDLSGDTPGAECLLLEYTRGHRVFVPLEEFGKIQKFVGSEGKPPRLSALSGAGWNEAKRRIKEEAAKIAKELLEFQAMRAAIPAPPLGGDSHIEAEFAASFPFEETPDQARAIESVLSDLSGERAADRLLVGDVGFGKTEVAMRAALRCALFRLSGGHTGAHHRACGPALQNFFAKAGWVSSQRVADVALPEQKGTKADSAVASHRRLRHSYRNTPFAFQGCALPQTGPVHHRRRTPLRRKTEGKK